MFGLDCTREKENLYDYFAITIKMCQKDGKIVGHLPMEISQPTKYLLDLGAQITATLTSTSNYASPLVQGGLEIPCLIKVYMPRTVKNKQFISMYEEMIEAFIPREGRSTCNRKYFETTVKLPSQQTSSKEERKEHVIRQLC